MNRIISNTHTFDVYDGIREGETDEQAMARARKKYAEWISDSETIASEHPENNFWKNRAECLKSELATLQIETQDEYFERMRKTYLGYPAKEVTEERWWEMFEVLPPCGYKTTDSYEMFYVSEDFHYTYHSFYLRDKKTGKCYTKLGDSLDRSTWIDVALGYCVA